MVRGSRDLRPSSKRGDIFVGTEKTESPGPNSQTYLASSGILVFSPPSTGAESTGSISFNSIVDVALIGGLDSWAIPGFGSSTEDSDLRRTWCLGRGGSRVSRWIGIDGSTFGITRGLDGRTIGGGGGSSIRFRLKVGVIGVGLTPQGGS